MKPEHPKVFCAPSVRIERSWKRKKIPGLRCSSSRRHAFAESGPTSVRVYVCRGRGGIVDGDGACACASLQGFLQVISRPSASSERYSYVCMHTKSRGIVCPIERARKGERQDIVR